MGGPSARRSCRLSARAIRGPARAGHPAGIARPLGLLEAMRTRRQRPAAARAAVAIEPDENNGHHPTAARAANPNPVEHDAAARGRVIRLKRLRPHPEIPTA
jgi:hypothetical protein